MLRHFSDRSSDRHRNFAAVFSLAQKCCAIFLVGAVVLHQIFSLAQKFCRRVYHWRRRARRAAKSSNSSSSLSGAGAAGGGAARDAGGGGAARGKVVCEPEGDGAGSSESAYLRNVHRIL